MVMLEVDRWLRERPSAADLAGTLRCVWWGKLASFRIPLPDECLDITWIEDGTLWLSGPESRSWEPAEPTAATALGVRFEPGVGPALLGMDASDVRDVRVPLAALWGDRTVRELTERMALDAGDGGRVRLLEAAVRAAADGTRARDDVAAAAWLGLARSRSRPARALARSIGLSERQLLRRCRAAFGYGPARLARILRLQRLLHLARTQPPRARLAELALLAGYADQQHLTHDVGSIFGVTPSVLLAPVSDRCKTHPAPADPQWPGDRSQR
jgi:AraC-like DNA-binding protein